MIKSKKEIDFISKDCLYSEKHCFEFENSVYEDLRQWSDQSDLMTRDKEQIEFRIIFFEDDYDYVAENYTKKQKDAIRKAADSR